MAANFIAAAIGAVALGLVVWGQHLSDQRRARREAARTAIPHQRQGDQS
ncbi:hypothetical protein OG432_24680 [Streptomyces sp. NBC_00442]